MLQFHYESETADPVDAFQVAFGDSSALMMERKLAYQVGRTALKEGAHQQGIEIYTPIFAAQ